MHWPNAYFVFSGGTGLTNAIPHDVTLCQTSVWEAAKLLKCHHATLYRALSAPAA